MHEIINKLIQQIDEEQLECLCWLLNTIGKALEAATKAKLNAPPGEETQKNVSILSADWAQLWIQVQFDKTNLGCKYEPKLSAIWVFRVHNQK